MRAICAASWAVIVLLLALAAYGCLKQGDGAGFFAFGFGSLFVLAAPWLFADFEPADFFSRREPR